MEQVTENVFTNTKLRGCNPSFVKTSDGVVVVDTPQLPTKAVAMREEAESHGPIRYLINTEHHVDHIFGNYYFRGAGTVIHHQGVYDNFMTVTPDLDPYAYALEAIPTDDPEGEAIFPERDAYYADNNKATIIFTGDVTLDVGDHRFELLWTPGHTPGSHCIGVGPVIFTGDTLFPGGPGATQGPAAFTQIMESLDTHLFTRPDDTMILPGHGLHTTIGAERASVEDWRRRGW